MPDGKLIDGLGCATQELAGNGTIIFLKKRSAYYAL